MSCYIPMTYLRKLPDAASGEENAMRLGQLSYYHVHMSPGGPFRSNFSRFIYRRLKNMKDEEERCKIQGTRPGKGESGQGHEQCKMADK